MAHARATETAPGAQTPTATTWRPGVHSLVREAEAGKITTELAASIESYLAGLLTCTETLPRP